MGLHDIFCALARIACQQQELSCEHYHEHDIFKGSMMAWEDLKQMQETGAEKCGYTKFSWNEPHICRHCFEDLSHELQQAVLDIGTDAHCWDSAVEKFQGYSHCMVRAPPPRKGKHCVKSWGVHNSSYVTWHHLSPHQMQGAMKCHYTIATWDGPVECVSCFEDLSIAKRKKLEKTGPHHAACWDQLMAHNGMDCQRVVQDIPFAERKTIYGQMMMNKFSMDVGGKLLSGTKEKRGPPRALATISLFCLAVTSAVFAVVQLWRSSSTSSSRLPSGRYALVHCEQADLFPE